MDVYCTAGRALTTVRAEVTEAEGCTPLNPSLSLSSASKPQAPSLCSALWGILLWCTSEMPTLVREFEEVARAPSTLKGCWGARWPLVLKVLLPASLADAGRLEDPLWSKGSRLIGRLEDRMGAAISSSGDWAKGRVRISSRPSPSGAPATTTTTTT